MLDAKTEGTLWGRKLTHNVTQNTIKQYFKFDWPWKRMILKTSEIVAETFIGLLVIKTNWHKDLCLSMKYGYFVVRVSGYDIK